MTEQKILNGDALETLKMLPKESVDCVITSPPYWGLRDYGMDGQLGLEPHFDQYIQKLVDIFDEVKRVLKKEGTCWVNLGDTYSGNKEGKTDNKVSQYLKDTTTRLHKKAVIEEKCLCQIPSRFALAMTEIGWILRNEIIWHKPNAMPSSVTDRFTVDFEKIFFFVKSKKYKFEQLFDQIVSVNDRRVGQERSEYNGKYDGLDNAKAFNSPRARPQKAFVTISPEGKNKRTVWSIPTRPYSEAHFATFPETLVEPMVLAGCPEGGTILDVFSGAATTGVVAKKLNRNYIGIEINPEYVKMSEERLAGTLTPLF